MHLVEDLSLFASSRLQLLFLHAVQSSVSSIYVGTNVCLFVSGSRRHRQNHKEKKNIAKLYQVQLTVGPGGPDGPGFP